MVSNQLRQELGQRQIQAPILTQEMRLSIELLQKNILDLREFLLVELDSNPFLELEDWGDENTEPSESEALEYASAEAGTQSDDPSPLKDDAGYSNMSDLLAEFDWKSYTENAGGSYYDAKVRKKNDFSDDFSFEDVLSEEEPLPRKLDLQIASLEYPDTVKEVMVYLVYNMDAMGFVREEDEQIAETLGVPVEDVTYAREELRYIEPEGIGSRSLRDYFSFIFTEVPPNDADPESLELVKKLCASDELLDLLMKREYEKLCKAMAVDREGLVAMLAVMKMVPPFPAFGHENFRAEHVIPDLRVHLIGGEVVIEMENKFIPSVRLNKELHDTELKKISDRKKREFMKEKYRAAEWIIKSLTERNRTLYEVASSIFTFQRAFLEHGEDFLKPLTLRDISDMIGRHQSTVSRLTSGKYVVTPHGIFELKYFFVKKVNDESVATTNKHLETKILELIEKEDKIETLSDEDIVRLLQREGIDVARRTIAKYRAKMKIPSARERKLNYEFGNGG